MALFVDAGILGLLGVELFGVQGAGFFFKILTDFTKNRHSVLENNSPREPPTQDFDFLVIRLDMLPRPLILPHQRAIDGCLDNVTLETHSSQGWQTVLISVIRVPRSNRFLLQKWQEKQKKEIAEIYSSKCKITSR